MDRANETQRAYRGGDSGVKYLLRGPRIDWGVILLLPGERLGLHYHDEVEETFYFIQGAGKVCANGEEYNAVLGDVFRLDPTEVHDILNDTDQPSKLLFIKCPYLPDDNVSL
jgi:quercetin dioxygenase-like cupin family protein